MAKRSTGAMDGFLVFVFCKPHAGGTCDKRAVFFSKLALSINLNVQNTQGSHPRLPGAI